MHLSAPGLTPFFPSMQSFGPGPNSLTSPFAGGAQFGGFEPQRMMMIQMFQMMQAMLQMMGSLMGGQGDLGAALGMPGMGGGIPGGGMPALGGPGGCGCGMPAIAGGGAPSMGSGSPLGGGSPLGAGSPLGGGSPLAGSPGGGPMGGPAGLAPGASGQADPQFAAKLPPALRPLAGSFEQAGRQYGIDPKFLAAISMMETGGGKSSAFRNKNNAMGVSGRGGPKTFSHPSESINQMARTLANPRGYYKGAKTIREIGRIYAPVGAANDPKGTNGHWVQGVSKFYAQLGGNPNDAVIRR